MRPLAPVQGMEAFFGRLRDPWSGVPQKDEVKTATDWIRTCDHEIKEEVRYILQEVLHEMDLLSEPIAISSTGPTQGGHRLPADRRQALIRYRARVLNMLVARQVLKSVHSFDHDPSGDRRDGFVVIADREPVQRTLETLNRQ